MKYLMIVFCLITACAMDNIQTSYNDDLDKFIGYPENELYDILGIPDRMFYVTNNEKVVTYLSFKKKTLNKPYKRQIDYSGINEDNHWWNRLFGPPQPKQPNLYYCKTSFVIKNGSVNSYSFNGDYCVAK